MRYLSVIGCFLCLVHLLGCDRSAQKPTVVDNPSSARPRPALRIALVADAALADAIAQRWRTVSEQDLAITTFQEQDFLSQPQIATDVIIYPSYALATLVEREWISVLPKTFNTAINANNQDGDKSSAWPLHWQLSVQHGKKHWGVPLGAPLPLIAMRSSTNEAPSLDVRPIAWDSWLESLPPAATATNTDNSITFSETAIVDGFLAISAALRHQSSGFSYFFDMRDMRPKLTDAEFIKVAQEFVQLVRKSPESFANEPESNWKELSAGRLSWVVGWPDPPLAARAENSDGKAANSHNGLQLFVLQSSSSGGSGAVNGTRPDNAQESARGVDTGRGLIVSASRNSRQSSASVEFMKWLDSEDTRTALARVSSRVASRAMDASRAANEQPQVANYDRWVRAQWNARDLPVELRLSHAERYRSRLAKALIGMAREGGDVEAELRACSQDWEAITEQLGRQNQRLSLERCLNISE